jgi:hypothetical protein
MWTHCEILRADRDTDGHVLRSECYAAGSGSFPVVPPGGTEAGSFAIYWGLDDKLKTPYSRVCSTFRSLAI